MQRTIRRPRRVLGTGTSARGGGTERTDSTTTEGDESAASPDATGSEAPGGAGASGADPSEGRSDDGADEEGPPEDEGRDLPKDVQFDILKNRRRRLVLRFLFDAEEEVSLGTLSEHVASVENDKEVRLLDSQERKRAYVGLYQCHLPRMDDADVVDYNKDRGQVSLGRNAGELERHIERADDGTDGRDHAELYLASGLVGLGGFLVAQSGAVAGLFAPAVVVLACLAVVGLAAVQLRTRSEQ